MKYSLAAAQIWGFTLVLTSLSSSATISPLRHPLEKEYFDARNNNYAESLINKNQLKTCAYYCLNIGLSKAYYHDSQKQGYTELTFLQLG